MRIIGIETSHDDTSIAIIEDHKVLAMHTFSQIDIHKQFGGTVPEIASREHANNINIVWDLVKKDVDLNTIDYVAYTKEPGLIGSLQIGYLFAQALALSLNKPLIPINHIEGHFFSNVFSKPITYPAMALIVSGGHSQLMYATDPLNIKVIGETLDDAVGEVYDKVARKMGLGFPGGPIIDKLSQQYQGPLIEFSIPKTHHDLDFSFSGLKTQVVNYINNYQNRNEEVPTAQIAASFQKTILKYLEEKISLALNKFKTKTLCLAGGVSANKEIRELVLKMHENAIVPPMAYTTDNGAMIAVACLERLKAQNGKK